MRAVEEDSLAPVFVLDPLPIALQAPKDNGHKALAVACIKGARHVKTVCRIAAIAACVLIAAAPVAAQTSSPQQSFANGNDWASASVDERRAFLFGISNAISVGNGWDERHVPAGQVTFARRAGAGLAGVSQGEAMRRIDAWYAANPGKRETPVVAVMWLEIAKPKLKPAK